MLIAAYKCSIEIESDECQYNGQEMANGTSRKTKEIISKQNGEKPFSVVYCQGLLSSRNQHQLIRSNGQGCC